MNYLAFAAGALKVSSTRLAREGMKGLSAGDIHRIASRSSNNAQQFAGPRGQSLLHRMLGEVAPGDINAFPRRAGRAYQRRIAEEAPFLAGPQGTLPG